MNFRSAWENFPDAITNGNLGDLKKDPEYVEAKAGDEYAAWRLVNRLFKEETIISIIEKFNPNADSTLLLPVLAEEHCGYNKIPLATAILISKKIDIPYCKTIFQTNCIGRTNKNGDSRLLFQPTFGGIVEKGKNYILIDDTLTMGGTIAALRSFVIQNGANVIGAIVMTSQQRSLQLAPTAEILENIRNKFGENIEDFLNKELGYGLKELTQAEASHIYAYKDFNSLRVRFTQTRYVESCGEIGTGGNGEESEEIQIAKLTVLLREKYHPKAILKTELPVAPCRGEVVYEGEDFIIQQVATDSRYFQLHKKENLSRVPSVGEKPSIRYSSKEKLAKVGEVNKKKRSL